jgi:hypothetical protein
MSALIIRPARGTFTQRITRHIQNLSPEYRQNERLINIGVIQGRGGLSRLEGCTGGAEFAERLSATVRSFLSQSCKDPEEGREVHVALPNLSRPIPGELRDLAIAAAKNKRLIYIPDRTNFRVFMSGNQQGNLDQIYSARGEEMQLIPELWGFQLKGAAIAIPLLNFPEIKDIYDLDPQPTGDIQVVGMITITGPKNFLDEWTQLGPLRRLATHAGLIFFNRHLTS